ncbi:hypothetical protein KIPB_007398, partial [Kipferlia bialata]|eukprot:g7398.t1
MAPTTPKDLKLVRIEVEPLEGKGSDLFHVSVRVNGQISQILRQYKIKMGILDRIESIELEMERMQKNKATEHHRGMLKAQLAKLRAEVIESQTKTKGGGSGFDVAKTGPATVAM